MANSTERNIQKNKALIIAGVFTLLFLGASNCVADSSQIFGSVKVYKEAPSAYEIAKTLFPPKTRKIILDQEPGFSPGSAKLAAKPVEPTSVAFMVKFEYDSVLIQDDSLAYLDALGDMLKFAQLKDKSLRIEGHADASGDATYNLQLSEARAKSIKFYLQTVHDIDPKRLSTIGYGESKLLDPERPTAEVNRRAEFSPG